MRNDVWSSWPCMESSRFWDCFVISFVSMDWPKFAFFAERPKTNIAIQWHCQWSLHGERHLWADGVKPAPAPPPSSCRSRRFVSICGSVRSHYPNAATTSPTHVAQVWNAFAVCILMWVNKTFREMSSPITMQSNLMQRISSNIFVIT